MAFCRPVLWASHFNIIAWPVTHAILPRYLQRQFAKLLYELRFHLIRLSAFEPAMVGASPGSECFRHPDAIPAVP